MGQWSTPVSSEPKNLRLGTMPPTEMPPKDAVIAALAADETHLGALAGRSSGRWRS
jgi:hypothetical protein